MDAHDEMISALRGDDPASAQSRAGEAGANLTDVFAAVVEHDGQRYVTAPAKACDKCEFYWRDGGIYDACLHPDQPQVKRMCGAENRTRGINVIWVKAANE